jgi:hypothetical protein
MKGTYFRKDRGKWLATAMVDRKRIHIGLFVNREDAKAAYDKLQTQLKNKQHNGKENRVNEFKGLC